MKKEKDATTGDGKSEVGKNTAKSKTNKAAVTPAAADDHTGASSVRRANSGKGLQNEGTNVSYEDENRNG